MSDKKTFETRIRSFPQLSKHMQSQVVEKLSKLDRDKFRYTGYSKVDYTNTARGLRFQNVEPIEGNINDYFRKIQGDIDIAFF